MSPREPNPEDDGRTTAEASHVQRYAVRSLAAMLAGLHERVSKSKPSRGVPCGVEHVDVLLGGFRPGRVTVLGASTSWGKSSFAVMVTDVGLRAGARILLVSGEDPEDMYAQRMMARRSSVNALRLRDGGPFTPDDHRRMVQVVQDAEDEPYFLNGVSKPVEYLAKAIEGIVGETSADLVIVDYVQAFSTTKRTQDRRNEVTHIFRTFADAIKASGAAGLILSQLRRLEENERPGVHDLKESGDVENGAEHVLLGFSVTPKARDGQPPPEKQRFLSVAKNKDGPIVDEPIAMPFNAVTASFVEQKIDRGPRHWQDDDR
jgi:replicative DNA helicase